MDVDAVADLEAGVAADEFAFDGWLKDADPGAFFGGAGDEAVVLVAIWPEKINAAADF